MNNSDLRERLSAILDQEDHLVVDWLVVNQMLDRLNDDLKLDSSECPHFIWHFVADSDIRAKDAVYADHQREEIRRFVETGEYDDGKKVRPWGCVAVALTVGALLFWPS